MGGWFLAVLLVENLRHRQLTNPDNAALKDKAPRGGLEPPT